MCLFCDALEQWVCSCGAIVPIGAACECGERQSANSRETETVEIVFVGVDDWEEYAPNRAARRRAAKADRALS
jgi:hypothetical protein